MQTWQPENRCLLKSQLPFILMDFDTVQAYIVALLSTVYQANEAGSVLLLVATTSHSPCSTAKIKSVVFSGHMQYHSIWSRSLIWRRKLLTSRQGLDDDTGGAGYARQLLQMSWDELRSSLGSWQVEVDLWVDKFAMDFQRLTNCIKLRIFHQFLTL